MNRNDYRRAFIMLRAAMQGYGGHVRLERRTLTGSLYFVVTAPQGVNELSAALAGQRDGQYYAAPIGALCRDRRGQLSLAWTFDPRSIDGRPLEAYAWVTVAATGGSCALALVGNVDGSRPVEPQALARAVCARLAPPPAADLPEGGASRPDRQESTGRENSVLPDPEALTGREGDNLPAPEELTGRENNILPDPEALTGRENSILPVPEALTGGMGLSGGGSAPEAAGDDRCDIRIYTRSRTRRRVSREGASAAEGSRTVGGTVSPEGSDSLPEVAPGIAPDAVDARINSVDADEPRVDADDAHSDSSDARIDAAAPGIAGDPAPGVTAARKLGLDITRPWAGGAEPLRRLFATQAPAPMPLGGGYVYVAAPLPGVSGPGFTGLRAEDGRVTAIRYAVPGRRAPQPPAGMEDYRWQGAVGEDGYWVLDMAP